MAPPATDGRDRKRGKRQIVVGLLTDTEGFPLSVEVFKGNTQDPKTVASQIHKLVARFEAREVTLVGDRGMLKSLQLEGLAGQGFHYLTAIAKPQIGTLLARGVLQMELFEDRLGEVQSDGIRYLIRRDPQRAEELQAQREDKWQSLVGRAQARTTYLHEHPRASAATAIDEVKACAHTLRIDTWTCVETQARTIEVRRNETALTELARLDGCYVIKTDVDAADASANCPLTTKEDPSGTHFVRLSYGLTARSKSKMLHYLKYITRDQTGILPDRSVSYTSDDVLDSCVMAIQD